MNRNLHFIPVGGGEPIHYANPECWCHPTPDTEAPENFIHNAADCREKFERQGIIDPNRLWVTIGQCAT